jgi:holin-like protein
MLQSLTILLVFQLIGEVLVRALALPIPGPVIGMVLLFVVLVVRGTAPASLTRTANGLLDQLSLLYVPAGVGIMVNFVLIQKEWLAILLTLILSTTITVIITALVMRWLVRRLAATTAQREGQL